MFKTAKFIFNDRASVLLSENGINQKIPREFTSVSQIEKWLSLIETVTLQSPKLTNIDNQIIYFKIIRAILRNKNWSEPVLYQQVQAVTKILYNQHRTPLWFGYVRQSNKLRRPFVYFPRL